MKSRRELIVFATGLLSGGGVVALLAAFARSMAPTGYRSPPQKYTIDISKLPAGTLLMEHVEGKPIGIIKRTPAMLNALKVTNPHLRDPESQESTQPTGLDSSLRSIQPELFVFTNICTHAGCSTVTIPPGAFGITQKDAGFHCPCHGSWYDMSGRVRKLVPAPLNLAVPEYRILDEGNTVEIISSKELRDRQS